MVPRVKPAAVPNFIANATMRSRRPQRLALDARHDTGNKPTRLAHLDYSDHRAIRFSGGERLAPVIQLLHGALQRFALAPTDAICRDTKVLCDLRAPVFDSRCFAEAIQQDIATGSRKRSGGAAAALRSCYDRSLSFQYFLFMSLYSDLNRYQTAPPPRCLFRPMAACSWPVADVALPRPCRSSAVCVTT
jgi:hypothetical protein